LAEERAAFWRDDEAAPLHMQSYARDVMRQWQEEQQALERPICTVCQEQWWRSMTGETTAEGVYTCARCVRERKTRRSKLLPGGQLPPFRFSDENDMIPSAVPEELKDLSVVCDTFACVTKCVYS
jgi:hypothetical protein